MPPVFVLTKAGFPSPVSSSIKKDGTLIHRELDRPTELQKRIEGLHAPYDIGPEFCDFPIYGTDAILAVLRIPKEDAEQIGESHTRLLHSIIESTALAMERFESLQTQAKIREEAMQEHYRGNLLRAISHDLRTPLSGIMGTSEMIMDMTPKKDLRYELAKGIYKDADWLHSLVENILNLTRLQDGGFALYKELEAVEEVVGVAVKVIEKRFPQREITLSMPDMILMVPMDARLISQVLVNLLDNAVKHTPDHEEIRLSVSRDSRANLAVFVVEDNGRGIPEADLPYIFQQFYTTRGKSADAQRGVGLGLSICQSIVQAHGGQISAENKHGHGAKFTFTLPLEEQVHDKT